VFKLDGDAVGTYEYAEELVAVLLLLLYACALGLLNEVDATLVELVNAVEDDVLLGEEVSVYVMV